MCKFIQGLIQFTATNAVHILQFRLFKGTYSVTQKASQNLGQELAVKVDFLQEFQAMKRTEFLTLTKENQRQSIL